MPITDESFEASRSPSPAVSPLAQGGELIPLYRAELIVCALIAISYLLVWPIGEYALLDDWAYARSLKTLHDEGRVEVLDWNPMSLVGHLAWGIAWTKALGFSLNTARLSVVVLHLIECLTLLRLLRWAGVGEGVALAAGLSLIFNPLHFVHGFSFMTDIPALAWTLTAFALYVRGLVPGSPRRPLWLLGGSLAAGMAFLTRQNGILVPAALFLYALVWDRSLFRPRRFVPAFVPAVAIIAAGQWWYQSVHGPTSTHQASFEQIRNFIGHPPWNELPRMAFTYVTYLGWMALPLSAGLAGTLVYQRVEKGGQAETGTRRPRRSSTYAGARSHLSTAWYGAWSNRQWLWLAGSWVVVNGFAVYVVSDGRLFPSMWNVITPYGYFGPDSLFSGRYPIRWNATVGFLLALLSVLSALVVWRGILGERTSIPAAPRHIVLRRFALLLLALQLCYCVATAPILFDRHLLIVAPTAIIVVALHAATNGLRFRFVPFAAMLIPAAFYSIAGTHDLHSTSRAVWEIGCRLVQAGNDPVEINAGYAFDGWHNYARMETRRALSYPRWWDLDWWKSEAPRAFTSEKPVDLRQKGWWYGIIRPDALPRYLVAPLEERDVAALESEYAVVERERYRTFWPWKIDQVVALRARNAEQVAKVDATPPAANFPVQSERRARIADRSRKRPGWNSTSETD